MCFTYYFHTSWSYMFIQFVVTELIRRYKSSLLKPWYIISSIIYVSLYMCLKHLLFIFLQPILCSTIIFCGGKKAILWITGILLLGSFNTLKFKYLFWYLVDREDLQDEQIYLLMGCIAWILLRCISFSIDYIDNKDSKNISKSQTFLNMLSYVMYLPVLYLGPVILYKDFERSFSSPAEPLLDRIKRFVCDISLFLLYFFGMELALHFIHFHALKERIELLRTFSVLALGGGGLWMGIQFHVKYVIAYGMCGALAKLDNIDSPPTPRCIARIHVYSHMWRYFDVGLYQFLVKYIYKPLYLTLSIYPRLPKLAIKMISSLFTFIFIFIWHGTTKQIFVWSFLNFLGIILETLGKNITETEKYKRFVIKYLKSDAMETRFKAMMCTPLLILSAVSNFYLFGGMDVGDLYFQCFVRPKIYGIFVICLPMYCCCQVSMALQDVPSRTDVKKITVRRERSETNTVKTNVIKTESNSKKIE
ncbi:protein-cysteine N-palmitoyltransferase Rasp isoform X2 [Hyposmocoma kahamanoa]|nr:protein-cysteine N-palmitoyltransferase Rasp isoform X2 [Hyposmocoma kahamanoa]XP_026320126.1 protein-cysteine N-palmitoyltransferase Rasp isoform X2 [Hyposmocoma kahamanoa]